MPGYVGYAFANLNDPDQRRHLASLLPYLASGVAPHAAMPLDGSHGLRDSCSMIIDLTLMAAGAHDIRSALAARQLLIAPPPLLVVYKTDLHPGLPEIELPPDATVKAYRRHANYERLVRGFVHGACICDVSPPQ